MISNSQSKFIKALKIKKYRLKENCFLIEGRKNVLEAIASGLELRLLLGTRDFYEANPLPTLPERMLLEATGKELVELGTFQNNEECLAVATLPQHSVTQIDFSQNLFLLDNVGDPGNLGTIIRTLDWFGHQDLVCAPSTTDAYSPKVIAATMGSFCRVRVHYVHLPDFIQAHPHRQVAGADMQGIPLKDWNPEDPAFVVMGSESHGLSAEMRGLLTKRISIPGSGKAESLNVAMSAGIIAYHLDTLRP